MCVCTLIISLDLFPIQYHKSEEEGGRASSHISLREAAGKFCEQQSLLELIAIVLVLYLSISGLHSLMVKFTIHV